MSAWLNGSSVDPSRPQSGEAHYPSASLTGNFKGNDGTHTNSASGEADAALIMFLGTYWTGARVDVDAVGTRSHTSGCTLPGALPRMRSPCNAGMVTSA